MYIIYTLVNDNNISIALPEAEILDVIINPSGLETFDETGLWTFKERQNIQMKASEKLKKNAIKKGIINKSKKNGHRILESFFKSLGFENVIIKNLNHIPDSK